MADILLHETGDEGNTKKRRKGRKLVDKVAEKEDPTRSSVVYIGRIPHGFYESQMKEFFEQFGTIKKLRISRNKKTGNSRHYGFIKFESFEVAAIVAESMNNYLLFESLLQVKVVPIDKQHPKIREMAILNMFHSPKQNFKLLLNLSDKASKTFPKISAHFCSGATWSGANRKIKPGRFQLWQKMQQNRMRTPAEQKRQIQAIIKKDKRRRLKLKAAGIDFDYPDVRNLMPVRPKKTKFDEGD